MTSDVIDTRFRRRSAFARRWRRAATGCVLALVASLLVPLAARAEERPTGALVATAIDIGASVTSPKVSRAAGQDHYETAVAVSKVTFKDPDKVTTVVVASGQAFEDGLTAGPAAVKWGAPVLLTRRDTLPASVAAEIKRLAPERVVLMGGPVAVAPVVETKLRALAPRVERIAGTNAYGTSLALFDRAYAEGANEVVLATGSTFPDALAGGALAADRGAPLLLIPGKAKSLPRWALDALERAQTRKIALLGGPAAISTSIEASLRARGLSVSRLAGKDSYGTALAIARQLPVRGDSVVLVTGRHYSDALSALPLAAKTRAPILLTRPVCAADDLRSEVARRGAMHVRVVGGVLAVRGLAAKLTPCKSTTSPRSPWVLVNKRTPLAPKSFTPPSLRRVNLPGGYRMTPEAASALERLAAAARKEGAGNIGVASAYRSYSYQSSLYNSYLRTRGRAWTDRQSARPGHSEHQTGLAADVIACGSGCGSIYGFAGTRQQRWVAKNAHRFGFIVRYESGRTGTTGYAPEPWHLRYVGVELATDYRAGGFHTYEDYLGAPDAPSY